MRLGVVPPASLPESPLPLPRDWQPLAGADRPSLAQDHVFKGRHCVSSIRSAAPPGGGTVASPFSSVSFLAPAMGLPTVQEAVWGTVPTPCTYLRTSPPCPPPQAGLGENT